MRKWPRTLVATILILQQFLVPATFIFAADTTGNPEMVEISYKTNDRYTPESNEYISVVNSAAQSYAAQKGIDPETYNFYTLSGVVKTIKAIKDDQNPDDFYKSGAGVEGYVIVAYDKINAATMRYSNWIAATTTNANGKFSIPIEKTRSGVYIVVLRPMGDSFKYITSYDVSSILTNRIRKYPYNGLNIGVIETVEDPKSITEIKDRIPNSIKVLDEKNEKDYYTCGDPTKISSYKYKSEEYKKDVSFEVGVSDKTYLNSEISLDDIKNKNLNGKVPTSEKEEYKDKIEGRMDGRVTTNKSSTTSALSFWSGSLNTYQPLKSSIIPDCDEFVKSGVIINPDPNKNYLTFGGLSNLSLPGNVENKIKMQEISDSILKSSTACLSNGVPKSYYEFRNYPAIIQNFFSSEDFTQSLTARRYQYKVTDDALTNDTDPNKDVEKTRTESFNTKKGDKPGAVNSTTVFPKENEIKRIFSDIHTSGTENGPYNVFNIPGVPKINETIYIYELGPMKSLCQITDVKENGKNLIKNEARQEKLLSDGDNVAPGYVITSDKSKQVNSFFGDNLVESVISGIANLFVIFSNFLNPNSNVKDINFNCLTPKGDSKEKATQSECENYNQKVCTVENGEYYKYTKFLYKCEGSGEFIMNAESLPIDNEDAIAMKGNTPSENVETIKKSLTLSDARKFGESTLYIGKGYVDIFEATKSGGPKMLISKDADSPALDTLDHLRFSYTIPTGNEFKYLGYDKAIVRFIDREGTDTPNDIYAGGGVTGGNQNIQPLCDNTNISQLTGATNNIAIIGLDMVKALEPGFWSYWNKNPLFPQYWDEALFRLNAYPDLSQVSANSLFWCTALTKEAYLRAGKATTDRLGVGYIASYYKQNQLFIDNNSASISNNNIQEGDVIFFSTGSGVSWDHIALVYKVDTEYIETIHANAACIRYTLTRNNDGSIQTFNLDGTYLRVLGFGRTIK